MYEPIKKETQEQYLKIWFHFSVGHFNQRQIAELFGCSEDTVRNAIKWSAENRIQFPTSILAEAAKEALENRLREFKNDLVKIKENNPVNWNAVIGINRLIKDTEELLWKLQAVIQDKSFITINNTQVNQVTKAKDEAMEVLNDVQRKELASRVREIIGKQANN